MPMQGIVARSLPGVEIDHPPDGAYERALAALSVELASVGLLELNVWRGGAAVCSLDRAVGGQVVRDVCDAATAGRPEGATMRQRRTHVDAEIVAAPILFEQRVLGALSARFDSRSAATAAQSQVEQGAERLAALLEVGRLSRRNAALSQDWETVVSALQSIAGGNDLHTICDAARRHVSEAIDFEAFLVARTLAESGELEVFYLYEDGLPREVSFRYALAKESPGT
ncbi:MAG: hypothetical protein KGM44_04480, partial [bacterium]|nr:hypothetical protein [bacterium]